MDIEQTSDIATDAEAIDDHQELREAWPSASRESFVRLLGRAVVGKCDIFIE